MATSSGRRPAWSGCRAPGPPPTARPRRRPAPCPADACRTIWAYRYRALIAHLLGQVQGLAKLVDGGQLGLPPVDVALLLGDHRGQELPGSLVADLDAGGHVPVQVAHGGPLQLEGETDLLGRGLADPHRAQALQVGVAVQVEDAVDQLLAVAHLLHGDLTVALGQPLVAPVGAHPGVEKVLVDGGQLEGQVLVEELEDARVALQGGPPGMGSGTDPGSLPQPRLRWAATASRRAGATSAANSSSWRSGASLVQSTKVSIPASVTSGSSCSTHWPAGPSRNPPPPGPMRPEML